MTNDQIDHLENGMIGTIGQVIFLEFKLVLCLVWGDIKDRLETVGVNQSQICCVAWRGSAGPVAQAATQTRI